MDDESYSKNKIKNYHIERSLLAGLLKFPESLYEFEAYLTEEDFHSPSWSKVFSTLRYLIIDKDVKKLDSSLVIATISNMGHTFPEIFNVSDQIRMLIQESQDIEYKTVGMLAKDVRMFSLRREIVDGTGKIQKRMIDTNFTNIQEVVCASDELYFEMMDKFVVNDDIEQLGMGAGETLHQRADNPIDHIGFSSGFSKWDEMIGYFRPDMVSFISARAKVGKSIIGLNIGHHVARVEKLPVLYMDSEMSRSEVRDRLVSHVSQVDIELIENGRWRSNPETCKKVQDAIPIVESLGIEYLSIRGANINTILSGCRRFLFKTVKRNSEGKFNQCLLIYDYLKLDYSGNLGDTWHLNLAKTVVNMKDFVGANSICCLMLGQQNRGGIVKVDPKTHKTTNTDTEEIVAGTDEVLKTSSNVSSLRFKTPDEIKADGEQHGNISLMPFVARHGKGGQWCMLSEGVFCRDYINLQRTASKMTFNEISTKAEVLQSQSIGGALK